MEYRNTTSVPDTLLRDVIRFACPAAVTNYSIWFKRAGGGKRTFFAGTAYYRRRHVVCRIPARFERLKKPYHGGGLKPGRGYLPWPAYTFEEALVALVAHELTHLQQAQSPRLYRRTWNARGQFSERDCDAYRDEHYHHDYASAKEAIQTYITAIKAHRATTELPLGAQEPVIFVTS